MTQPYLYNKMRWPVIYYKIFCNVRKVHIPWSHKESISLFIFTSQKLIMPFDIKTSLEYKHHRSVSNRIATKEPKMFTFYMYARVDIISVSVARNFRDPSSLKLSPVPHTCYRNMIQNYLRKNHSWMKIYKINVCCKVKFPTIISKVFYQI